MGFLTPGDKNNFQESIQICKDFIKTCNCYLFCFLMFKIFSKFWSKLGARHMVFTLLFFFNFSMHLKSSIIYNLFNTLKFHSTKTNKISETDNFMIIPSYANI